jgi:hypothetical protein
LPVRFHANDKDSFIVRENGFVIENIKYDSTENTISSTVVIDQQGLYYFEIELEKSNSPDGIMIGVIDSIGAPKTSWIKDYEYGSGIYNFGEVQCTSDNLNRKPFDKITQGDVIGLVLDMRNAEFRSKNKSPPQVYKEEQQQVNGGLMYAILNDQPKGLIAYNLHLPLVPAVTVFFVGDVLRVNPHAKPIDNWSVNDTANEVVLDAVKKMLA